ncbi:AraC family transcriptional regulator [Flavitalea flava]
MLSSAATKPLPAAYSFSTTIEDFSFFAARAVTSSRIEIVCIEEGSGFIITGNDRTPFKNGDVIMTGTHLCHQYKLNDTYGGVDRDKVKVAVLRFVPDFWGDTFLNLNENTFIKVLLDKANLGIMPDPHTCTIVRDLLGEMMTASGTGKIILLLEILNKVSVSGKLTFLSVSQDFSSLREPSSLRNLSDQYGMDRLERVYKYSRANFHRRIDLEEIAAVAYVSPNSFCRWFKSKAQKTYSRYLIELRVRHACHLLVESSLCAKKICTESGFNNFSNFHKCFKEYTGKSPVEYQKKFKPVPLYAQTFSINKGR